MGNPKGRRRKQCKKKIGRNVPCPCGSGKKYKKCHGRTPSYIETPHLSPSVRAQLDVKMAEMEAAQRQQKKQQGLGRPIISLCHMGYRIVEVGGILHSSKKWKTFHDFLIDYVSIAMGGEWGNEEIKKDFDKRHPILQWYEIICKYQRETIKKPGRVSEAPMTGAVQAYLGFSYNLYLLAHNLELQSRLINRLKNPVDCLGN